MKRRNRDEYSEYSDRKRVEAITISRQTRSKMPPIGCDAQCAPVVTKRRRGRRPMTPRQFKFMRRFSMRLPPTRQGAPPGSCALIIEPTVTRMARSLDRRRLPAT
jgi:hypothetical protein